MIASNDTTDDIHLFFNLFFIDLLKIKLNFHEIHENNPFIIVFDQKLEIKIKRILIEFINEKENKILNKRSKRKVCGFFHIKVDVNIRSKAG